jgi:hypothetical protein
MDFDFRGFRGALRPAMVLKGTICNACPATTRQPLNHFLAGVCWRLLPTCAAGLLGLPKGAATSSVSQRERVFNQPGSQRTLGVDQGTDPCFGIHSVR